MAFVTDPDDLDRYNVLFDPVGEWISIRGLGTERHALDATGDSDGTTTFTDAGANFTTDGVLVGDILTIISDPDGDGNVIGHYVVGTVGTTTLVVDRTIPASVAATLAYKVNAPKAAGGTPANVADGVSEQAIYSFAKEEWRTNWGVGNSPDLIKFVFPLESITREQFEIGGTTHSGWDWKNQTTKDLIRTGGWKQVTAAGVTQSEYAGVVTLGSLDSDAQVYHQQGNATGTPANFVLTGATNQAVLTFGPDVGPTEHTSLNIAATTLTRTLGSWTTDNYRLGDYITIRSAEDSANNGSYGPVTAVTGTVLTIGSASWTPNAADTAAIIQVDHRKFLKLFVRKKARSYAGSDIAAIGVTTLETIVNRFPLTHVPDPAIVATDGTLAGVSATSVYQNVTDKDTGTDGAPVASAAGNATFAFSSASSFFQTTNIVVAGDTIEFTTGSDQGYYEISSVDSETALTLFQEPGVAITGGTGVSFTTRTKIRHIGAADGALANVDGSTGTLTSVGGGFTAAGIVAGDMLQLTAGVAVHLGTYKVITKDSDTQLTINTSDEAFTTQTGQTFRVLRKGMHLQYKKKTITLGATGNLTFANANPDTITRASGNWTTDGVLAGDMIVITGSTSNNGSYTAATVGTTVLTLVATDALTAEGPVAAVATCFRGFRRTLNGVVYGFNYRQFGNGALLSECFQWMQRQLRRATDIDEATSIARGDVTDLLQAFASPNTVTTNLVIDNVAASDLNNLTEKDDTGVSRNDAFLSQISITISDTLVDDADVKLQVYWTDTPSQFGTVGALMVQDSASADMEVTNPSASPVTFTYNYDAAQNGHGGGDENITIVAIGKSGAQYIKSTGQITRQNTNPFAATAALERNFLNPT